MNFEDIEIKTVEKLDLKSGDVLVAYLKTKLPEVSRAYIQTRLAEVFKPKEVKVIVLQGEEEIKFQVLRVEE